MKFNPENPPMADDRFDLLSAYLDGEVTPSEREKVQHWLDTDEAFQQEYRQLLRLQQEIHHLPEPSPQAIDLADCFFQSFDRRQRQRRWAWAGGVAIAAVVLGLFSQLFLRENALIPQLAERFSEPVVAESDSLTIALNHPPVDIPLAAR